MPFRPYNSLPSPKELPFIGSVYRRFRSPLDFFVELKQTFGDAVEYVLKAVSMFALHELHHIGKVIAFAV